MFLDRLLRLNPELARVAVRLHQSGDVLANTYLLDLDAIRANVGRIRAAADSAGLSAPERARNLSGRVRLRRDAHLHPRAVTVLIDDVITTGTTAAESARVLAAHGIHLDAVLVIAAA